MMSGCRRWPFIAAFCLFSSLAARAAEAQAEMVVVPFEEARFVPFDASRPEGPKVAVLWGDPDTGPSAMLLKLKKSDGRLHVHTSDYHLVVVQGRTKHWAAGASESGARELGPGSYWFQPGSRAHADSCLSEECLLFVQWAGKRDGRLAESTKP